MVPNFMFIIFLLKKILLLYMNVSLSSILFCFACFFELYKNTTIKSIVFCDLLFRSVLRWVVGAVSFALLGLPL